MPRPPTWTAEEVALLMHKREVQKDKWEVIALEMGRSRTACQAKWDSIKYVRHSLEDRQCSERKHSAEARMLERDQRATLPARDLTAQFFGDPPTGRSALDMRASA